MSIRIHVTTAEEADAVWCLLCAGDLQHDAEIHQDGGGLLGTVVRVDGRPRVQKAADPVRTAPAGDDAGC
jgi:hypothetical protein